MLAPSRGAVALTWPGLAADGSGPDEPPSQGGAMGPMGGRITSRGVVPDHAKPRLAPPGPAQPRPATVGPAAVLMRGAGAAGAARAAGRPQPPTGSRASSSRGSGAMRRATRRPLGGSAALVATGAERACHAWPGETQNIPLKPDWKVSSNLQLQDKYCVQ